ncbi:hypothetical protein HPT27_13610 [Permianibacter sp. IMCC34836]|uniref:glucosaminidase domain-containing protein n=1 Tax=Permianibacter fluminis TaxID=2738515 RepID=UPI0015572CDD|nr:glucosaminidase domain-containing protein [Permianibacter fluminis]NQD38064.1 hypothetical protein [Permianibacter fluminis]
MAEQLPLTSATLPDAGSYHDLRALNKLRNLAQHDEQAALKAAAKQFESVFLQQLLKAMRAANEVFEDDDFFGGGNDEVYQQMHDEQLALSLANNQSLGLAERMVQQLSQTAISKSGSAAPQAAPETLPAASHLPERSLRPHSVQGAVKAAHSVPLPLPARPPLQAAQNPPPATPAEFVKTVLPHAEQAAEKLGVSPLMLLAQAALETGWGSKLPTAADNVSGKVLPPAQAAIGQSSASAHPAGHSQPNGYSQPNQSIPMTAASSHQYFGIKADSRWTGKTVTANTLEYGPGNSAVPARQRASFRAYDSVAEAFADYADFIKSSPRYAAAVEQAGDPAAYAKGLQQGGYATDPNYANKLIQLFNSDSLRDLVAKARELL